MDEVQEMKAFPRADMKFNSLISDELGMDLRDYFAAKAMQAYLTGQSTWTKKRFVIYAKIAYEMADAMMEARDL